MNITRQYCLELDMQDPLAHCRERFDLPPGEIYLDGNSIGAMPKAVAPRMRKAVEQEWAHGLIRSWNDAQWYPAPQRTGGKISALVGAHPDEVIVADSTSVNLFKMLVAGLRMRPGRKTILAENGNFPTDVYVASGVAELMGAKLVCADPQQIIDAITDEVAIVSLTHANYKTGRLYDMAAVTAKAHEKGALIVWDLCHSAGAMPVSLNDCNADFAVGCGYKYLNGGPGAPAFAFVARRHQESFSHPLTGWHGHARPFEFVHDYAPAPGIDRLLVGTAPQLGVLALEAALTAFDGVDMRQLRAKSVRLCELFIALVDEHLAPYDFGLATPREAAVRGSQVSLTHRDGYAIVQALIARGITGDFRAPDILRFGFAPLYVRHVDIYDSVLALKEVMESGEWDKPEFKKKKAVT